ncbi:MAG: hypothetical protein ABSD75_00970 [Terriglobales bacterium]|jgi:hypothetical protein
MSPCHQTYRRRSILGLVLVLVLIALPALLNAQTTPPPKAPSASTDDVPKAELFLGYQWLNPGGNVPDQTPPPAGPLAFKLPSIAPGFGAAVSYNFTSLWSLEGDYGVDWNHNANVNTLSVGPKLTFRGDGVNFFVHTLLGGERLSPRGITRSFGIAPILGGGMDLKLWKPLTLRLFEADFQYARENFSSNVSPTDSALRRPTYDGVRLRTGFVFNFGGAPELPVSAACTIDRNEVMVGEPLHVTVAGSNFNPKHSLTYAWSSTGGKIEGKDTGASIDTNGAAAGNYTATATVTDAKSKTNNSASCSVPFTVKPLNPPQISCTANPTTVEVGTSATISCSCTSPDNVPVTVGGWNSSGGSVSGSGNSATLSTTGASAGTVTVNATCTDSRGLTASTSSSVVVNNPPPPPPPPPAASKLNECEYPNLKKPWRVDNTCKAELDDVALKLQQDSDAKLVVVGNADPKEKRKNLAAERALNVKAYLSGGEAKQNIDASRIEARTGNAGTATTEQWIVPAGATFPNADSTTPVDETKVKAVPDHPKPVAKKAVKKAQ